MLLEVYFDPYLSTIRPLESHNRLLLKERLLAAQTILTFLLVNPLMKVYSAPRFPRENLTNLAFKFVRAAPMVFEFILLFY